MSELPWRRLTLPTLHTHRMQTDRLLSVMYTAGLGIGMKPFALGSPGCSSIFSPGLENPRSASFPFLWPALKKKDLHDILRNTATEQRHY